MCHRGSTDKPGAVMSTKEEGGLQGEIDGLARQVDRLIATCGQLQSENDQLRGTHTQIAREKEDLVNRNREAKQRIDRVIDRLRNLDPN